MTLIRSDKSGRVVIPKKIREEMGIRDKTSFIVERHGESGILLVKFDVELIAKDLERELKGVDVEGIARQIRKEINAKIAAEHPELR